MTPLPPWAQSPHGRALIAQSLANPPERYVRKAWGCNPAYERFNCSTSKPFAELRRMHKAWRDAEFARLDGRDQEAASAVLSAETPDDLLLRLLDEERVSTTVERDLRFTIELQKPRRAA